MFVEIVSLVDWSYHVNAIDKANCDIISSKLTIYEIRDFETPISLYDCSCAVLKKASILLSNILCSQQLQVFLLHFQ